MSHSYGYHFYHNIIKILNSGMYALEGQKKFASSLRYPQSESSLPFNRLHIIVKDRYCWLLSTILKGTKKAEIAEPFISVEPGRHRKVFYPPGRAN